MQRDITRQEALGFILRGILEGIGLSQVAVALVDRGEGVLRGELALGTGGADVRELRVPLASARSLLVMALERRSPVGIAHRTRESLLEVIGGALEEGAWTEALGTPVAGTRAAFLAVPLIAREEVVGVIVVSRSEPPVVRRHEVELLLLYANTAGLTVERAELYTRMHRSLEQLEVTDHVSHLMTLGAGSRRAAEAIARCAATGQSVAGLMVGVDGFAEYNDRCGRERGDRSLGEIGDLLRGTLGADDVALRYGGRLLAAIVRGVTQEQAAVLAQRIGDAVRQHRFEGRDGRRDQQLTVSIGWGHWGAGGTVPAVGEVLESLLGRLRRAEASGGGGVVEG
jgi:diguanylate cyclase (GGDEF)-like protein